MAAVAPSLHQLASEIEQQGLTPANADRLGRELAAAFGVQEDEVGILRVEGASLVFCYPAKLQGVGRIPLNTSGSVAARTANSRRPEIINNFAQVKHTSFFEAVDLAAGAEGEERPGRATRIIQKLMSAPVMSGKRVRGVIQISRKAEAAATVEDFSPSELERLVASAAALGRCLD